MPVQPNRVLLFGKRDSTHFPNRCPSGGLVRSRLPLEQGLRGALVHHAARNLSQLTANVSEIVWPVGK